MRKFLTIGLLVIFSSATTEFGQFLKIPILIQHFYQHQQRNGQSLWSFINEHYGTDHQDADKDLDQQLPFKSIINAAPGVIVLTNQVITVQNPVPLAAQLHQPANTAFIPSKHLQTIFHPPRTV